MTTGLYELSQRTFSAFEAADCSRVLSCLAWALSTCPDLKSRACLSDQNRAV